MIESPVEAVSRIYWTNPKAGRAVNIEKAVRVENEYLFKVKGGGFVYTGRDLSKHAYMPGDWPWNNQVMKGLVAIGAITQEDMDKHLAACKARTEAQNLRYARDNLLRTFKDLGMEIPQGVKDRVGITPEIEARFNAKD